MELIYISGGQRSGKSSFAMKLALEASSSPVYLATARVLDEEFADRVKRHKDDRDRHWTTIEIDKKLSSFPMERFKPGQVVLLDCITMWLTNILLDNDGDMEKSITEAKTEWAGLAGLPLKIIAVSNEIGMGLVSEYELGRKFVDTQGFVNQYISGMADEVYFMVSGQPLRIPRYGKEQ